MVSTGALAAVALGGALGASLRFLAGGAALRVFGSGFPWGTLIVNVAGCFAMGAAATWLAARGADAFGRAGPFLLTGVLGGFTTFSAFAFDAAALTGRGAGGAAAAYVAASVALSLGALWAGMWLTGRD